MNEIIEQRRKFHTTVCYLVLAAALVTAFLLVRGFAIVPLLILIVIGWKAGSEAYLHHEICPATTIVFYDNEKEKERCSEWAKAHPHDFGYLFYAGTSPHEAINQIRLYRIPQALFCEGCTHEEEILAICQKYGVTVRYPRKKSFCFSYG